MFRVVLALEPGEGTECKALPYKRTALYIPTGALAEPAPPHASMLRRMLIVGPTCHFLHHRPVSNARGHQSCAWPLHLPAMAHMSTLCIHAGQACRHGACHAVGALFHPQHISRESGGGAGRAGACMPLHATSRASICGCDAPRGAIDPQWQRRRAVFGPCGPHTILMSHAGGTRRRQKCAVMLHHMHCKVME